MKKESPRTLVLKLAEIAAAGDEGMKPPSQVLLLPYGTTETDCGPYTVDPDGLALILQQFQDRGCDMPWDYEHQTLQDVQAPAAGWIRAMAATDTGLVVTVEWTDRALEYLSHREYRYYSPVVILDSSRRVIGLHSVALTNTPKTHGLAPLVAKQDIPFKKEERMNEILKALGLPATSDQAAAVAAIQKLQNSPIPSPVTEALGLAPNAEEKDVVEAVHALKQATKSPQTPSLPPRMAEALGLAPDVQEREAIAAIHALKQTTQAVPMEEFWALKARLQKMEADGIVMEALKAGKIAPAQKEWAEKYAQSDIEGFRLFVEKAPVVVALKNLPGGSTSDTKDGLTEAERRVAAGMGVSLEDLKKYGGE